MSKPAKYSGQELLAGTFLHILLLPGWLMTKYRKALSKRNFPFVRVVIFLRVDVFVVGYA